jgi:hypothetical protein
MGALIGVIVGAVIGWALKTFTDWLTERRGNRRADLVWRREKYVDAVAEFLHAANELRSADAQLARAIYSSRNAENVGRPDIIETCRANERAAGERQAPWTTAVSEAMERVRLYAPDDVVALAQAVRDAIQNRGTLPRIDDVAAFEQRVNDAAAALATRTRELVDVRHSRGWLRFVTQD